MHYTNDYKNSKLSDREYILEKKNDKIGVIICCFYFEFFIVYIIFESDRIDDCFSMPIRLVTYERSEMLPEMPEKNVFHSVGLFRVLEHTPGFSPFMLVAYDGDKPIGKLLCVVRQNWFIKKCTIYDCGEYFDTEIKHELIFDELLTYFTNRNKDKYTYIEFRNLSESLFGYRYFRKNGYFPVRRLRVINSIHHKTIDKWMDPSRRRQINAGFKNGVQTGVVESKDDISNLFRMLKNYYSSKILRYLPEIDFFNFLFDMEKQKEVGKIFTVSYKGKIIGGSCCLFSDDTAYLLFSGGMRKRYPSLYPGVMAVWEAMVYSREKGYSHFEFIDAGLPLKKYSYRNFILKFGGKQVASRRWYFTKWNYINRLLTKIYL